jgi:glycosyltransferase involved in cell wall biosynthesis
VGTTTTVFDCSGVGAGGITRVLTELVRHWPAGHRIEVVAAPQGWQPPVTDGAEMDIVSYQHASRAKTITFAARKLRQVRDSGATQVLSLSPSLAIVGTRLPVTTIVHDLAFRLWSVELSSAVRRYRRVSYSVAPRRSGSLVCVSSRTQHDLFGVYGISPNRTSVWTPGSDLNTAIGELPAQLKGLSYLLVAGHAAQKGVELAIEALPAMPGLHLAVLTGGVHIEKFPTTAASAGVADRVIFLGRLSDAEYAAAVNNADVFLMPSHFEGYGLPAVEAIRLGTPTVISPDPALYEATGAAAARMTTWTAAALVRAVVEARRGDPLPSAPVGRSWSEATVHLFDLLHTSVRRSD